jgi:hypothetical protein
VAATLDPGAAADILIVNTFGKQEIAGRGFRPLIAAALLRDLPVLTAVNPRNLPAFLAFSGGLALPVSADPEALRLWCLARITSGDRSLAAGEAARLLWLCRAVAMRVAGGGQGAAQGGPRRRRGLLRPLSLRSHAQGTGGGATPGRAGKEPPLR